MLHYCTDIFLSQKSYLIAMDELDCSFVCDRLTAHLFQTADLELLKLLQMNLKISQLVYHTYDISLHVSVGAASTVSLSSTATNVNRTFSMNLTTH
jgi:hypothetical protein